MKINSELPITLLNMNEQLNEFDLVLFHLYKSESDYKSYFNNIRKTHPERLMIFDNSAYEFFVKGEELNLDEYAETIKELNPDYYILPDVLMDTKKTLSGVRDFLQKYGDSLESTPMAVVQGDSIVSMGNCLMVYYEMGIRNIAVPFHNSFFKDEYDECNGDIAYMLSSHGYQYFTKDVRYAAGRCMWVNENKEILSKFEHIHFLGSHCPAEKGYLKTIFPEATMDTGYPVKCALQGWELGREKYKPDVIIDDFMHDNFSDKYIELIKDNINKFKSY